MIDVPGSADKAVQRLARFPAFLHANGFALGAGDAVQALQAAVHVGVLEQATLRASLKAMLCSRADEWRRFDALFDAWFLPANRWQRPVAREVEEQRRPGTLATGARARPGAGADDDDSPARRPREAASPHEALHSADFRTLTAREHLLDIEAAMRRFARALVPWPERRLARAATGRRLAMGATLRASLTHGGTPFELAWKDRRRVRPRLVLLVDVSRSMAAYSFFHLRLARALATQLAQGTADVRTFIFHTRLTAVTRALHDPDPWRAQEQLHFLAQGFGGGTRIGECLAQFLREEAGRLVHSRTAVLVFSDGYDTGEPAQLGAALAALARQARRIVWLNPLAAQPGFAPLSQGLVAALPHVHLHAPAHDLASLEAVLPRVLAALR
ncbi:MAG: VWA domain-containing protein [Rubrivivax sp.]|nr:VWA domain-containing protein [Rubrivivax sp.]